MYATCLRCERPLGTNAELSHLPVGRRIAFDTARGRLWVICRRCGQWNLTPIERRWEALEECERLALGAEARVAGAAAGLARTSAGLELLRVGGMPQADIANWRYGRRLQTRRRLLWWTAAAFASLAIIAGVRLGLETRAPAFGVYVAYACGGMIWTLWQRPRSHGVRVRLQGRRRLLWPWQLRAIAVLREGEGAPPALLVPRWRASPVRLQGPAAAEFLAELLPKINGGECVGVSPDDVVARVAEAEAAAGGAGAGGGAHGACRPWEHLVAVGWWPWLTAASPETRLALEMAVTEEVEAAALAAQADALADEWRDEEVVGEIADDLLLPDAVRARVAAARRGRRPGGGERSS